MLYVEFSRKYGEIKDCIDNYNVELQAPYIGEESYSSYTRNPTTTQLFKWVVLYYNSNTLS